MLFHREAFFFLKKKKAGALPFIKEKNRGLQPKLQTHNPHNSSIPQQPDTSANENIVAGNNQSLSRTKTS
jgi:hypothetical protein